MPTGLVLSSHCLLVVVMCEISVASLICSGAITPVPACTEQAFARDKRIFRNALSPA
jgi:hypothetical protein